MYIGRLAPSPTGALHLGNVRTFMVAWLRARTQGGKVVFRMEDLDHPKDKPGAAVQAVEDLRWLGFDWDEEYVQSERKDLYRSAINYLLQPSLLPSSFPLPPSSFVYPCTCSRKDVESAQSAPHAGEQLYYPGTCRGKYASWAEAAKVRPPCWRFRVEPNTVVSFEDVFAGPYTQDVSSVLGDFPIARDEGGAGYTLACAVDDVLMGVTEVVRGDDLLPATPAQILLVRALAPWFSSIRPSSTALSPSSFLPPPSSFLLPSHLHLPLVVGPDGRRLAKRHGDTRIASFRAQGWSAQKIIGLLAASCGWAASGEELSLADLLPRFTLSTIPHAPFVFRV